MLAEFIIVANEVYYLLNLWQTKGNKRNFAINTALPLLDSLDLQHKTVLLRVDLDVPLTPTGEIADDIRIKAHIPTINYLLEQKAVIVLVSSRGKAKGRIVPSLSMHQLVQPLSGIFGKKVTFVPDSIGRMPAQAIAKAMPASILLLENVEFHKGEIENSPAFAASLAKLGDAFVNDSFASSYQKHASTASLPAIMPTVAGFNLVEEFNTISNLQKSSKRPLVLIVGGMRLARKVDFLRQAIFYADQIILSGTIANTMLAAKDIDMGRSVMEPDYIEFMRNLLVEAGIVGCRVLLPQDVVTVHRSKPNAKPITKSVKEIEVDEMALDVGPKTIAVWSRVIQNAGTVVWNGPIGSYEVAPFEEGTGNLANAIALSPATSLAVGNNTLEALNRCHLREKFNATSCAKDAFLNLMAGEELPAIQALQAKLQVRRAGDVAVAA